MALSLTRIHHVGVVVRSLDSAYAFWRDTLGLPISKTAVVEDQGVAAALLPCGESEIELLEPVNENGGVAKFLEKRGEGLHHVCFQTPDVAAALEDAQGRGIALIDKAPRKGLAGMIGFLHPKASCGTLIEYATPFPDNAPPETHPPSGPFKRLRMAGVAVQDAEAAEKTFHANFDLACTKRVNDPGRGARVAFLPVGRAAVALMAPTGESPAGLITTRLSGAGEGIFLIGIEVDDFGRAARRLEDAGYGITRARAAEGIEVGLVGPGRTNGVPIEFYAVP